MTKSSDYSTVNATFESDGHTYEIFKLSTAAWLEMQGELMNQLKGMAVSGVGSMNPKYTYNLLCKLFKHAEVDGFPVDIDAHFGTDSVKIYGGLIGAIKATDPRFFTTARSLIVSAVSEIAKRLPSEKSASELMTSVQATAKKGAQSSQ